MTETSDARRVLLLTHTGRAGARDVARSFCKALTSHGIAVRLLADEARDLDLDATSFDPPVELAAGESDSGEGCELAVVIGGDGTILRAAEITHASGTPVLGVNLGHVGFLAEAEYDDVESTIDAIVHRRYTSEERTTIEVSVLRDGEVVWSSFALNEASVEKAARERMLELVLEIDGRPLSRWGCDGVVCATPTGSTAYNFSAGGPIVWPGVEAMMVVPISAHALFARPMVVAPDVGGGGRGARPHRRLRRAVVRRPAHRRPAAGRADRGTPRQQAGPPGPAARGAVHRPAGRQVRAAGRGLARLQRAAPSRQRRAACLRRSGSVRSG